MQFVHVTFSIRYQDTNYGIQLSQVVLQGLYSTVFIYIHEPMPALQAIGVASEISCVIWQTVGLENKGKSCQSVND